MNLNLIEKGADSLMRRVSVKVRKFKHHYLIGKVNRETVRITLQTDDLSLYDLLYGDVLFAYFQENDIYRIYPLYEVHDYHYMDAGLSENEHTILSIIKNKYEKDMGLIKDITDYYINNFFRKDLNAFKLLSDAAILAVKDPILFREFSQKLQKQLEA